MGGQAPFRIHDGPTSELYWLDVDSANPESGESWHDYVSRSAAEVQSAFVDLVAETDCEAEARDLPFLAEKLSRGDDVKAHLLFALYFTASESAV